MYVYTHKPPRTPIGAAGSPMCHVYIYIYIYIYYDYRDYIYIYIYIIIVHILSVVYFWALVPKRLRDGLIRAKALLKRRPRELGMDMIHQTQGQGPEECIKSKPPCPRKCNASTTY